MRRRFIQLLVGPAIALLLGGAAGPVISRLYQPDVFGHYAMLVAIVAILSVAVTARFEQLIPSAGDGFSNFWLGICFSSLGSATAFAVCLLFISFYEAVFIGLGSWLLCIFNCFYYLRITNDAALRASYGRVSMAGGVLGAQSWLGVITVGSTAGLLWGEVIGRFLAVVAIGGRVEARRYAQLRVAFFDQMIAARWLLPSALLGSIALQVLPFAMPSALGVAAAGVFMLVYRMVVIPNALISKVVSDSLLVEIGRVDKAGSEVKALATQGAQKLCFAAIGIYGVLAVQSGWLFPWLLGDGWELSGRIAPWLLLMTAFWSAAAPMAAVFVALGKTRWSLMLATLDIANRLLALVVGYLLQDIMMTVLWLATFGSAIYVFSLSRSLRLCETSIQQIIRPIWSSLFIATVGLVFCMLLLLIEHTEFSILVGGLVSLYCLKKVVHD